MRLAAPYEKQGQIAGQIQIQFDCTVNRIRLVGPYKGQNQGARTRVRRQDLDHGKQEAVFKVQDPI